MVLPCLVGLMLAAPAMLPVEFGRDPGFIARPGFLGNPAKEPRLEAVEGGTRLSVAETGKGMKFELPLVPFETADVYLVFTYRAGDLAGGYALWAYDGNPGGLQILGVNELKQDGQPHTVAINLAGQGARGRIRSVVTEVQCRGKPAWVEFRSLAVSETVPAGAEIVGGPLPPPAELTLRAADLTPLEPHPDWLATPSAKAAQSVEDDRLHLTVPEAGRGMKWSVMLREPVDLTRYRYLSVRYRAQDIRPIGDYFVWLGGGLGGQPSKALATVRVNELEADGRWRIAVFALAEPFEVRQVAFQVACEAQRGEVWVDWVRFTGRRPLFDLAELVAFEPGWGSARLPVKDCRMVDLSPAAKAAADTLLPMVGLSAWLPAGRCTVGGVPLEIPAGPTNVALSTSELDLALPVGGAGSELYLLLVARLPETTGQGHRERPFPGFSEPERFVARLCYAGGRVDEQFPLRVESGRFEVRSGPHLYCLPLARERLERVELRNRIGSARYLVAAATLNAGAPATAIPPVQGLPPAAPARKLPTARPGITKTADGYRLGDGVQSLELVTSGGLGLRRLELGCLTGGRLELRPGPLFELGRGELLVPSDKVKVGTPKLVPDGGAQRLTVPFDAGPAVPLRGELRISVGDGEGILMSLRVTQAGTEPFAPIVNFPVLAGVKLGTVDDTWYLYARKGGTVSNRPIHERRAYGGEHPLQVTDLFSPALGGGLALLTEDRDDRYRHLKLDKDDGGVGWRVEYWPAEAAPGVVIDTAPTRLVGHYGDWRQGLALYRRWAHSWYRPQVPRKRWFQEVFYYQQTNAWSSLYDRANDRWRMAETIAKYRDWFGCLDYLHIFDFGQSQVYGRVGDYNHYEELGGLDKMRAAVAEAQAAGVPVGLYIEGYLCDERGVWGREHVAAADIRQRDGQPLLWHGAPMEHMMCAASDIWRRHLVETYRRVAGELKPSGMYIDQYGFTNLWKVCWSREHGHPVPWGPLRGEGETTRAIRAAVPADIATLTEETPNDVHLQYQDGALGYSVWNADVDRAPHRADLVRFVFPDLKVLQLVSYDPFIDGAGYLLKYPFFNGEAWWLGGGTEGTYSEDAHRFLRRALAICHEHLDAFCSDRVEPLVPTLRPTVYANRFDGAQTTVWTLYNAEYTTFRGDLLRLPYRAGASYQDAFADQPLKVRRQGDEVLVPIELGPQAVGCIVERRAGRG